MMGSSLTLTGTSLAFFWQPSPVGPEHRRVAVDWRGHSGNTGANNTGVTEHLHAYRITQPHVQPYLGLPAAGTCI